MVEIIKKIIKPVKGQVVKQLPPKATVLERQFKGGRDLFTKRNY